MTNTVNAVIEYTASPRHLIQLLSVSYSRLRVVIATSLYFAAFAWIYVSYVGDTFASLGFGFPTDWPTYDMALVALMSIIPSFWIPLSFHRPSAVFIYIQYFLVYIPALWMIRHSILPLLDAGDQAILSVVLFISMLVFVWAHRRIPLLRFKPARLRENQLWVVIYAVTAALLLIVVVQLGGNFHLIGLADIYVQRAGASDLIEASGNNFTGYAFHWLDGLLLPLIFAQALRKSNYFAVASVVVCYLFLFGIWGAKTALFSPLILVVVSFWSARGASRMPLPMISGLIAVLIVPALLPFDSGLGGLIKFSWTSIVDMRTFSIPGLAIPQYFGFFSTHPLTLGSHITGLNWVIPYPYDYDIPRSVGYYYYGDLVTANANFWAQDGLASFGVAGVIGMTFVVAVVLWLFDSVTRGLEIRFVMTAVVGILLSFSNVSLFTTLITGGLGPFLLVCLLMPREDSARIRHP